MNSSGKPTRLSSHVLTGRPRGGVILMMVEERRAGGYMPDTRSKTTGSAFTGGAVSVLTTGTSLRYRPRRQRFWQRLHSSVAV
jgi:hypothetical protein